MNPDMTMAGAGSNSLTALATTTAVIATACALVAAAPRRPVRLRLAHGAMAVAMGTMALPANRWATGLSAVVLCAAWVAVTRSVDSMAGRPCRIDLAAMTLALIVIATDPPLTLRAGTVTGCAVWVALSYRSRRRDMAAARPAVNGGSTSVAATPIRAGTTRIAAPAAPTALLVRALPRIEQAGVVFSAVAMSAMALMVS